MWKSIKNKEFRYIILDLGTGTLDYSVRLNNDKVIFYTRRIWKYSAESAQIRPNEILYSVNIIFFQHFTIINDLITCLLRSPNENRMILPYSKSRIRKNKICTPGAFSEFVCHDNKNIIFISTCVQARFFNIRRF